MNGLHLCISSTAFIHHFYYYLFQADHIMSSSAAGPPPHLLVWGSAASSGNGSEAAGASGASSGFDSDSSPSSVASATSSSAGLRPCPSLAAISCSHLGARPKGRPLAPAVPPPPMGRPPSTSDPLTDCRPSGAAERRAEMATSLATNQEWGRGEYALMQHFFFSEKWFGIYSTLDVNSCSE